MMMEEVSTNSSILSKNDKKPEIPVTLCPSCRKHIPNLSLITSFGQMNVLRTCPCSSEEKITSLRQFITDLREYPNEIHKCVEDPNERAKHYCIDCAEWLCKKCTRCHAKYVKNHYPIEHEVKVECIHHKKPYTLYCSQCKVSMCDSCEHLKVSCFQSPHHHNNVCPIKLQRPNEVPLSEFDKTMNENKERTMRFIDRIDQQIAKLNQMKRDILLAFNVNEAINLDLITLYQSLCRTVVSFQSYPSIELMKLQQTIIINERMYIRQPLTIKEEYIELKKALQTHFIITQTPSYQCIASLIEHTSTVYCLIQLNDGRIGSGSNDNSIKLWDITTNICTATLTGHSKAIYSLIQLTDSRLASGSDDNTVKLWNVITNQCTATLTGHNSTVYCLCLLNDNRLGSGSNDYSIKLWNTSTNISNGKLIGHSSTVYCLIKLHDGRLASGSYDETIRLWNTTANACTNVLTGHKGTVFCLCQLNDGRLASGSSDCNIKVWSMETYEVEFTLIGNSSRVYSLTELSDGRLASGSRGNLIRIWNTSTRKYEATLEDSDSVFCLVALHNGKLASGSDNKIIKLWNV